MKKTYTQILDFWNEAANYLALKKDDKLTAAIKVMTGEPTKKRAGNLTDVFQKYNEEVAKIDIKHCHIDPTTKVITRDQQGKLQYTRDAMATRNTDKTTLSNKEFTFEPEYVSADALPTDLDAYQRKVFEGFVIEPAK